MKNKINGRHYARYILLIVCRDKKKTLKRGKLWQERRTYGDEHTLLDVFSDSDGWIPLKTNNLPSTLTRFRLFIFFELNQKNFHSSLQVYASKNACPPLRSISIAKKLKMAKPKSYSQITHYPNPLLLHSSARF